MTAETAPIEVGAELPPLKIRTISRDDALATVELAVTLTGEAVIAFAEGQL